MEQIKALLNALSITLLIVIVAVGYFVYIYINQLNNKYKLLKHRHVCEILEIEGPSPTLNYKRIPDLWFGYQLLDRYDKYSFKQSVIKKFVDKVDKMFTIEEVVNFFLSYPEVQRLRTVSQSDKEMIEEIYTEVCRQTETRVMLLAHERYRKLYVMHRSEVKNKAMVDFGLLLDHFCIKNFFPLSKTILDMESKELLQRAIKAKAEKRKMPEAPVIEMIEPGSSVVSEAN